jgi:hypothetical protein
MCAFDGRWTFLINKEAWLLIVFFHLLFSSIHAHRFQSRCSQQVIKEFPAIHEVYL